VPGGVRPWTVRSVGQYQDSLVDAVKQYIMDSWSS
jgi:hypothetical protein